MDPFMVSAGIAAIGKLFGGVSSLIGGNTKAKAFENAAQQADSEAGLAASQALEAGDATAARAATQVAANGGGFTGSALGEISRLSSLAMFNARAAVYRGNTQAQGDLYNAKVAKAQGLQGLLSSIPGAAGSIFGGLGQSKEAGAQMDALKALRGGGDGSGAGDDALAGLY